MPRTAARVTQADIARAIRALRAAGFAQVRVVLREGGVTVEPAPPADETRDTIRAFSENEPLVVL